MVSAYIHPHSAPIPVTGVAFILKLLNQNNKFDSLRWFQYLQQYYTVEEGAVCVPVDMQLGLGEIKGQVNMHTD